MITGETGRVWETRRFEVLGREGHGDKCVRKDWDKEFTIIKDSKVRTAKEV